MAVETDTIQTWPRRLSKEELGDALSQKKLALDQEIEEFRRQKEEELKRYGDELKSRAEDKDGLDDILDKRSKGMEAVASSDSESSLVVQSGPSEYKETADSSVHCENREDNPGVGDEGNDDDIGVKAKEQQKDLEVKSQQQQEDPEVEPQRQENDLGIQSQERQNDLGVKEKENCDNPGAEGKGNVQHVNSSKQHVTCSEGTPKASEAQPVSHKSHKPRNRHDEGQNGNSLVTTSGSQRPISKEDREQELRALFTPSFLPLLEDASYRQNHQNSNAESDNTSLELYQPSKKDRSHSDTSQLSSSLTTLPSSNNKLDSDTVSSSQARLGLSERRCSSSPTGTGRTLRSSLRSPDHIPKERKHVLFSIDDKVISPSTSPAAARSVAKSKKGAKRISPIPFSGPKDFPWPEGKAPKSSDSSESPRPIPIARTQDVTPPLTEYPATYAKKSYKDFVEPTDRTPPAKIAEEDMRIEASNPMFGLDGPETAEIDDFDFNEEEWRPEGRATEKGEEDMIEDTAADIAASPHAGSLPVEIKWPYRWSGVI